MEENIRLEMAELLTEECTKSTADNRPPIDNAAVVVYGNTWVLLINDTPVKFSYSVEEMATYIAMWRLNLAAQTVR